MTGFLSLFAGIGGFDLAAYRAGLRFNRHCFSETDGYASSVFQKRFPKAEALGDVRSINYGKLPKGNWIIAGGPPCQPFSTAGKRLQEKDCRNLWPEAVRAVRELKPRIAVFKNTYGALDYIDGYVLSALESEGYKTETVSLSAAAVGAPHKRERLWVIAHTFSNGQQKDVRRNDCNKQNQKKPGAWKVLRHITTRNYTLQHWEAYEHILTGDNNGIPNRVDRLKCSGNAIVPQCAEIIFMLPVFDRWRKENVS
jgi:DNA (cytosine-5)-methyltransferase 1